MTSNLRQTIRLLTCPHDHQFIRFYSCQVVKVCPNDKDARKKYTQCKKIVQEQAFARAIAVENKSKSICDTLDIESMGMSFLFLLLQRNQSVIDDSKDEWLCAGKL